MWIKSKGFFTAVVVLIFFTTPIKAQPYGNEWINPSQRYFKIKTAQNGVYRITQEELVAAGVPVSQIPRARFQLYHRGEQVAISVNTGSQTLQPGDFIEFYGKRNDGTLDTDLYVNAPAQVNPYFNIFSDTTAFFLTWNSTENGIRVQNVNIFNVSGLVAEPFVRSELLEIFSNQYRRGRRYPVGGGGNSVTYLAEYDLGEGWSGPNIGANSFTDINFFARSAIPGNVEIEVGISGVASNIFEQSTEYLIGPNSSGLISFADTTFMYENTLRIQRNIPFSNYGPSNEVLVRVATGSSTTVAMNFVRLRYDRSLDLQLQDFTKVTLTKNQVDSSFLRFGNPPSNALVWDITDLSNVRNIQYTEAGNAIEMVVPTTASVERELVILGTQRLSAPVEEVFFQNLNPAEVDFTIITHPDLRVPAAQYNDPVGAYADYRRSTAGGSYSVLDFNIEEVYNSFSFGEVTPAAIRRLCDFWLDNGSPQYLFLVGKGVLIENFNVRNDPDAEPRNLIPTFGFPGADAPFSSGFNGTTFEPAIPVGRLNAREATQVAAYLDKVIETEQFQFDDLWKKRVLQLSGGITQNELTNFRTFSEGFAGIAEGDFFGAEAEIIGKETSANVEFVPVADVVNEGLSLITFYGHSAAQLTDIDIGNVSDPTLGYANSGLYPTILVNGCNAGGIFGDVLTFGEDWMHTPNLGSIAFLAHSWFGFDSRLRPHTNFFYQTAYQDLNFIDSGIGDIHKETSRRFLEADFNVNEIDIAQVQQVVLQGDPAVKLFGTSLPDYALSNEGVFLESFNQAPITASVDSFRVGVLVTNFGATPADSVNLKVTRIIEQQGMSVEFDSVFYPDVLFQDTLFFTIVQQDDSGFGLNRFEIEIDRGNLVTEIRENNNSASFTQFIPIGGTENLSPYPFEIINDQTPTLIAQTNNLLGDSRTIQFEFDTVPGFNSPFLQSTSINTLDLAEWNVTLTNTDSIIYYWRTRFAQPRENEDTAWVVSSFTYINNSSEGWSQGRSDQFQNNSSEIVGIQFDPTGRQSFIESQIILSALTGGADDPLTTPEMGTSIQIDETEFIVNIIAENSRLCRDNTILVLAFDQASLVPYAAIPEPEGEFDVLFPLTCGRTPQVINNFTDTEIASGLLDSAINLIPEGDIVLVMNLNTVQYQSFGAQTFAALESIGATSSVITSLQDGEPYLLLGRKGDTNPIIEITANDPAVPDREEQISLTDQLLEGRFTAGSITSPLIGPVRNWVNLSNRTSSTDPTDTDIFSFDVIGFDVLGNEVVLLEDQTGADIDLSSINADTYPVVQLRYNTSDAVNLTPRQLQRWTVFYQGVPEAVLFKAEREGDNALEIEKQEGETFASSFSIRNVGREAFNDSLEVNVRLTNRPSVTSEEQNFRIAPLDSGQTGSFSVPIETLGKSGLNDFFINVQAATERERTTSNNAGSIEGFLNVIPDNVDPIVDVTFDGRYILDGDIVSPSPLIEIRVRDENQFILNTDTSSVQVFLRRPGENNTFEPVFFNGNPEIRFTPATDDSDLQVTYNPQNLEDGTYALRVQAQDANENEAGSEPFNITFEVINASEITHFYPYPNPFSTSCRFVFTLTGAEIPDEIKIQIMTVTGKVVREITQDEIGVVRIGNNITDYAWDGKDEYGDQLANGVYLYRVFVRSNGQDIARRSTSADRAFKRDYGKLYILR